MPSSLRRLRQGKRHLMLLSNQERRRQPNWLRKRRLAQLEEQPVARALENPRHQPRLLQGTSKGTEARGTEARIRLLSRKRPYR